MIVESSFKALDSTIPHLYFDSNRWPNWSKYITNKVPIYTYFLFNTYLDIYLDINSLELVSCTLYTLSNIACDIPILECSRSPQLDIRARSYGILNALSKDSS